MGYPNKAKFDVEVEIDEDTVAEWVNENLEPEDVFDEEKLAEWAREFEPDEIYEEPDLIKWAESHGWVRAPIIPDSGGHLDSKNCWCGPTVEDHPGGTLIIHNQTH